MNKKVVVITNNPDVYQSYSTKFNVEYLESGYYDVLVKVRDYVHQGYELVTHPLMGSVKPNETPYRSIILKKNTDNNVQSLHIIEESMETYRKFEKMKASPKWPQKVLDDFRFVDIRLFESSLDNIALYT